MVWIWSPYLYTDSGSGLLPKFNGVVPCPRIHLWLNLHGNHHSLRRYEPNFGKVLYLAMLKNLQKIPGSGSLSGWLPKFNQFFLAHRHICDKIFVRSVQYFLHKVANRQTNKHTNKRLGGGILHVFPPPYNKNEMRISHSLILSAICCCNTE